MGIKTTDEEAVRVTGAERAEQRFGSFEEHMGCISDKISGNKVIMSDESILIKSQPVTTEVGKNELPLIGSDMKPEVMACDGEEASLASMDKSSEKTQPDEKTDNIRKKKKHWKRRFMKIPNYLKGNQAIHVVKITLVRSPKKSEWILNPSLLMIVPEKINSRSKKAASYIKVSKLLEVSKVIHDQILGSRVKELASRVLSSSKNLIRALLLRCGFPQDNLAVSLLIELEKLYMWKKKLHTEVTAKERLMGLYKKKEYSYLKSLDQSGAESSEIYEVEAKVKLQLTNINVSVLARAVESVLIWVHEIKDEELSSQVNKIINIFKEMRRFLAKYHHKQFQARSKSCVHMDEKGSRKVTQKVEEQIMRFKESFRGYLDAHVSFDRVLNKLLNMNFMDEDNQTETKAPEIFSVCREWLRENNVDEVKVLSVVDEMKLRFRILRIKQVKEKRQRLRTERMCKRLEMKTKKNKEKIQTENPVYMKKSTKGPKEKRKKQKGSKSDEVIFVPPLKHESLQKKLKHANVELASQAREIEELKHKLRERDQEPAMHSCSHLKELVAVYGIENKPQLLSQANRIFKEKEESNEMVKKAVEVLEEMPEPDEYVLACLLDALCENSSVKDATKLFEDMRLRFKPYRMYFSSLLYGWCREWNMMGAKHVLAQIKEAGFEPDVFDYTNLLSGYANAGKMADAYGVLQDMRRNGFEPNANCYTITLSTSFSLCGHTITLSTSVFIEMEKMKQIGYHLELDIYNVKLACKLGEVKEADRLLKELEANGLRPEVDTFVIIINGLTSQGCLLET